MQEETEVKEIQEKEVAPALTLREQFQTYWNIAVIGLFGAWFAFSGAVTDVAAQTELNIDAEQIVGGFFDGANLVLGLGGLIAVLALPYGIQFAFNFIQGIFSKFSSIRFGG